MYDYTAADADEVSFKDGDTIVNVQAIDEGWMYGTVQRTGKTGMLPANYVEAVWAREQPSPGTAISHCQQQNFLPPKHCIVFHGEWQCFTNQHGERKNIYITKHSWNFFPSNCFWKLPANTTWCCSWELPCFRCPKPFWNCLHLPLKHLSIQYYQHVLSNAKITTQFCITELLYLYWRLWLPTITLFILPWGEKPCVLKLSNMFVSHVSLGSQTKIYLEGRW